jgi:GNAT superfamily N-acetyltransferase
LRPLAERFRKRWPVTIRPGNLKNIREESRRLRQIYNQAWEKNWGFVPFTEAEFEFMTHELKQLVIPEFTLIAEIGDEPAGFILCVPDINVALRHINGRLTTFGLPIGLVKLLYHKSRTRTARLIALGVIEKYRRTGIAEMLVLRIIEDAMIKRGFTGELSLTLEDNHMINRFLEAIGAAKYKTYRIYSRALDA